MSGNKGVPVIKSGKHFNEIYHRERAKLESYFANNVSHITAKGNKTKCAHNCNKLLFDKMVNNYYLGCLTANLLGLQCLPHEHKRLSF